MGGEIKQQLSNLTAENYLLKQTIHRLMEKPTMRDRFAMAALSGCVSNNNVFFAEEVAKSCYILADAMLKAREGKDAKSA